MFNFHFFNMCFFVMKLLFLLVEKSCLKQAIGFNIFRQEDKDREHDSSHKNVLEKFASMSIDDASLTDWHLGFHISLVY